MTTRPTLDQVAAQLGADPTDPRLVLAYDAAVFVQEHVCHVDPYTPGLAEALHRRVGFLWASRAHTLGVLDTGTEYGTSYMPMYHPDWDMLEGPSRIMVLG